MERSWSWNKMRKEDITIIECEPESSYEIGIQIAYKGKTYRGIVEVE